MVALEELEFQYDDAGMLLNSDVTPSAPFVDLTSVRGLSSAPFKSTKHERDGVDGGFVDIPNEDVRPVILRGDIFCNDPLQLEPFLDLLKVNFAPTKVPKPLYIKAPGVEQRVLFCKSGGIEYDWESLRRIGQVPFQIVLQASDPAFYGPEVTTTPIGLLVNAGGGRGYNKSYNYGYGTTTSSGGHVGVVVGGNRPTGATLVVAGPVEDAVITHEQSGKIMRLVGRISANTTVVINTKDRWIRLDGVTPRRNMLRGINPWFMLEPGLNSFSFTGSQFEAGPPDPSFTVIHRPAYR